MATKTQDLITVDNVSLDYGGSDGNGSAIRDVSLNIHLASSFALWGLVVVGRVHY